MFYHIIIIFVLSIDISYLTTDDQFCLERKLHSESCHAVAACELI